MNTATFSPCRQYRYTLTREVASLDGHGVVCWVMLNPSTATAETDDPTIRRVKAFSRAWGYRSASIVNLFAYRSTEPRRLLYVEDPVGPENDRVIREVAGNANAVVVAWGVHGAHRGRDAQVLALLAAIGVSPLCLGTTRGGHPKHPLYMPAGLAPLVFQARAAVAS